METAKNTRKNPVKTAKISVKTPEKPLKTAKKTAEKDEFAEEIRFSNELMSVSALSRLFNIDRHTVRTRIENAGIKPNKTAVNEKLYELNERLEAVLLQDELDEAKLRKIQAEAEMKEHELAVKKGEFGSVAEFTEITQRIFSKIYKRFAVQLPSKLANKIHNANSSAEVIQILKSAYEQELNEIRDDFPKYLSK
jgi:hypothetical protein